MHWNHHGLKPLLCSLKPTTRSMNHNLLVLMPWRFYVGGDVGKGTSVSASPISAPHTQAVLTAH